MFSGGRRGTSWRVHTVCKFEILSPGWDKHPDALTLASRYLSVAESVGESGSTSLRHCTFDLIRVIS